MKNIFPHSFRPSVLAASLALGLAWCLSAVPATALVRKRAFVGGLCFVESMYYFQTYSVTGLDGPDTVTSLALPSTVEIEGVSYPVTGIEGHAFSGRTALHTLSVPNTMRRMENYALLGSHIRTLIIEDGYEPLDMATGYGLVCDSLQELYIGRTLSNCKNKGGMPLLERITVGPLVASLNEDTYIRSNLRELVFLPAEGPLSLYLSTTQYGGPEVFRLGRKCVFGNGTLDSFNMKTLRALHVSDNVSAVPPCAFLSCAFLTEVTLPKGLKSIGRSAFSDCAALPSVPLPEELETIGDYAFSRCVALKEITLPERVRTIGSAAFRGDTALTCVRALCDMVPDITEDVFSSDTYRDATLVVPRGRTSDYRLHPVWSKFFRIEEADPSTAVRSVCRPSSPFCRAGGAEVVFSLDGAAWQLFSPSGERLSSGVSRSGERLVLPRGASLLRVGRGTWKIFR